MMNASMLSRRGVLGGAAGLVIGLSLPGRSAMAAEAGDATINAFVRIAPDSSVTVLIKHIEMGQGPMTGLSTLVAEELDADWSQVRAEQAPANAKLYANLKFGIQGTGGSSAIANSYMQMRQAGATARAMLVQAAAQRWKVKPADISVDKGVILHTASGRKGSFGEFASAAAKLPAPDPKTLKLKDPSAFRLIGKERGTGRIDTAGKTNGQAKFTIDLDAPGILTVLVSRSPRFGGKLASFDAAAAMKVRGVVAVHAISNGVAVYANGMWPAIKGRKALSVQWNDGAAEKRGTDQMLADFAKLAQSPGAVAATVGDIDAALAGATVIEESYVFPYLAHAPMEPMDGVLEWDRSGALARYGAQFPTTDLAVIAKTLGLAETQVRIETQYAGGSFGRRAQPDCQFALELAEVAKAIGPSKPVKLVWTREDDIHGGYYRSATLHRMRGGIKDGKIIGWASTSVSQSIAIGTPMEKMMIKDGIDSTIVEGASELFYDVGAFRSDMHIARSPVPVLWWRSVGHTHTAYAVECFLDQLLQKTGQDPVAGRLALIKDPRAAGVLKAVAELAKWSGPGPTGNRARGVAVVKSFESYVAQVAEVSKGDDGTPRVHKIWAAVDLGVAVNPDVIRAQVEGGIGYGLGHALFAEVPLAGGVPSFGNFDKYRSLRINEMPEVEVIIVPSTAEPTGIGEPGLPPVAPAVANALARLGVDRPGRLPMVRAV